MRVLVVPNSMKGTLTSEAFARAVELGLNRAGIFDIQKLPAADGGDGTAKVLSLYYRALFIPVTVLDPLSRPVDSGFYLGDNLTAIVEMADASGLKLLSALEYSAINTTSYGTGQLIASAVQAGAKTVIVGLGGSATVDGGMGALMALGVRFYNTRGEIEYGSGNNAGGVTFIDISAAEKLLKGVRLVFLTDVETPLIGKEGAARVFAPQKGATPRDVEVLDKNLSLFAGALFQTTGKDVSSFPGGGAAGGISASFHALFNAEVTEGASFILNKTGFSSLAFDADFIITGEGQIDRTSFKGKLPGEVLKYGMKIDKPVYAICGSCKLFDNAGFAEIIILGNFSDSVEELMRMAFENVEKVAFGLGKRILMNER